MPATVNFDVNRSGRGYVSFADKWPAIIHAVWRTGAPKSAPRVAASVSLMSKLRRRRYEKPSLTAF